MAIQTSMSCREIDRVLKAVLDVAKAENNGKILSIRRGELTAVDGEEYFDVTPTEVS